MRTRGLPLAGMLAATATLACSGGQIGEAWEWKRPCGTPEQRDADRRACLAEAAGYADPSDQVDQAQDLFARCMVRRGWRRVPAGTVLRCEQPDAP